MQNPFSCVYLYMVIRWRKTSLFVLVILILVVSSALSQQRRRIQIPADARVTEDAAYHPNPSAIKVARLHYSGGGDWYWGSSAIPNFLKFVRDDTDFPVDTIERVVTIMDPGLFKYPFLFATGHGTVSFSEEEKERLRQYLSAGGFLFINDSYGMETSVKKELAALFPERQIVELPFDHPLYHSFYDFSNGPPKIHEHDNKPPRGYAVILDGRVVVYFLVESDIGDGWEDPQVHNDPEEKRHQALKMGLNILTYALLY